jgi:hypothetical protein
MLLLTACGEAQNLFVSNYDDWNIYEVTPNGVENLFYNTSGTSISGIALTFDSMGDLFLASNNNTNGDGDIYEFKNNNGTLSSNLTLFASGVSDLNALAIDSMGDAFVSNYDDWNIYEFSPSGAKSLFYNTSGTGIYGIALAFDGAGDLFLASDNDIYKFKNNNGTLTSNPTLFASGVSGLNALAVQPIPQLMAADAGVHTNQFGFTLIGTDNQVVVVEACTNLAAPVWLPLETNTITNGPFYFSDPLWRSYSKRFYRLVSP